MEWKTYSYDQPVDLTDWLTAAGFVAERPETLLLGEVGGLIHDVDLPPGVRVRAVTSDADLARIDELMKAIWGPDRGDGSLTREMQANPDALDVVLVEASAEGPVLKPPRATLIPRTLMPSKSGKQPYDSYATGYAKRLDPTLLAATERLAELAGARAGKRVLDVATGTGTTARASARRGASVVGVDRSPGMLSVARKLSPELNLELGDVCALPFADCTFDAVTCGLSLSHFADRDRALREILRVLRPGGRLVASAWGKGSRLPTGVVGELLDHYGAAGPSEVLDEDTWLRLEQGSRVLSRAGFADVSVRSESFGGSFACAEEALAWALGWPLTASRFARLDPARRERLRRDATEALAGLGLSRRFVFNFYLASKSVSG